MSSDVELRNYRDELRFTRPVPRAVVREERLSFAARGLFVFLSDLPATWSINFSDLSQRGGPQGRTAIRSIVRELQTIGAVVITQEKEAKGRFGRTVWTLRNPRSWAREAPLSRSGSVSSPRAGFLQAEHPPAGEPQPENQTQRFGNQTVSQGEGASTTTTAAVDAQPTVELSPALAPHAQALLAAAQGHSEWLLLLDCELSTRLTRAERGEGPAIVRPRPWALATLQQWVTSGQPDLSQEAARLAERKKAAAAAPAVSPASISRPFIIDKEALEIGAAVMKARGIGGALKKNSAT